MISKLICFSEAVLWRCTVGTVFLEISQNSQENTCARASFLIKLQAACNFVKKEALAQVFSCEFCKISKHAFFYRTPPVAASGFCTIKTFNSSVFIYHISLFIYTVCTSH